MRIRNNNYCEDDPSQSEAAEMVLAILMHRYNEQKGGNLKETTLSILPDSAEFTLEKHGSRLKSAVMRQISVIMADCVLLRQDVINENPDIYGIQLFQTRYFFCRVYAGSQVCGAWSDRHSLRN